MKIILEKSLDFRQFQNLIILTFITLMVFLGMLNSVEYKSYYIFEWILLFLNVIFIAILFLKKGLIIYNEKLYEAVFLFGFVLQKKLIETSNFKQLILSSGKRSTNYAYSNASIDFHHWEPDLNHSETSFTIVMIDEKQLNKKKILLLTKAEKVKLAIDFISKNTNLKC
ncbi:hypothetical protein [Flavobacterium sp. RSSB_23]|uniref:hypothetical protein n=1 Tax=Flavobacterium sp. RSSB_23 TaxID=3447668 RepID=UPI003F398882